MHTYIDSLVYQIYHASCSWTHAYTMRGKNRREKFGFRETFFFSARFRKRENTHMETAPMYLYTTDFFARENAAKIAYMEKLPLWTYLEAPVIEGNITLHCNF